MSASFFSFCSPLTSTLTSPLFLTLLRALERVGVLCCESVAVACLLATEPAFKGVGIAFDDPDGGGAARLALPAADFVGVVVGARGESGSLEAASIALALRFRELSDERSKARIQRKGERNPSDVDWPRACKESELPVSTHQLSTESWRRPAGSRHPVRSAKGA